MSLLGRQDFLLPSFYVMRPRRAVPQKPQANFASMHLTILQTHVSSKPFKINIYKPTSQLLILNHLRGQLNPLDATFTKNGGGRGSGLVRRESCMALEIVTSHLIPFTFNLLRTLWHNEGLATPLSSIASALFPLQRRGGPSFRLPYFLTSFPLYFLTSLPPRPSAPRLNPQQCLRVRVSSCDVSL